MPFTTLLTQSWLWFWVAIICSRRLNDIKGLLAASPWVNTLYELTVIETVSFKTPLIQPQSNAQVHSSNSNWAKQLSANSIKSALISKSTVPQPTPARTNNKSMIYLLLLRFDDVHYGMIQSVRNSLAASCVILVMMMLLSSKTMMEGITGFLLFAIVSPLTAFFVNMAGHQKNI